MDMNSEQGTPTFNTTDCVQVQQSKLLSAQVIKLRSELQSNIRMSGAKYARLFLQRNGAGRHSKTTKNLPLLFARSDTNKESAKKFLDA